MTDGTLLVNQLPLLLICIPICGILTIGAISLIGREHLQRTFLLNGALTFGCAVLILFQFQFGKERTGLSAAESFQSVIELSRSGSESKARFGVDGCSLLLILFTSALPLLLGAVWNAPETGNGGILRKPQMTCGRAALVLLLQAFLLIFLTALDRRVQLVTLLSSTCVQSIVLSASSPSGRRTQLNRWQRQFLLSDFLIAAGMLAALTPLVRLAGIGNHPDSAFGLQRLLEAIELLRVEEVSQYVRLMSAVTPATLLMLVGCSLRFGMFPVSRTARTMWKETAPWQRLLIWACGPILGTAVLLRELQVFPGAAYQVIAWLKYFWLLGLFLSAIVTRLSTGIGREAAVLVYFCSLLFYSLAGPNAISLTGSFLLLTAIGLRLTFAAETSPKGVFLRYVGLASRFFLSAGAICTLIGDWQGLGAGSRGLGFSLTAGFSLLILGTSGQPHSRRTRRTDSSLLSQASRSSAPPPGEQPVWEISSSAAPVPVATDWQRTMRTAGLIVVACVLLMLPNFLWQRIRWDLQKIEFPQGEISLSAGGRQP